MLRVNHQHILHTGKLTRPWTKSTILLGNQRGKMGDVPASINVSLPEGTNTIIETTCNMNFTSWKKYRGINQNNNVKKP